MNEKNRGYQKIKGAASAFNFDFKNKTVLDIGSSTGGFTKYALDHGAKRVIAIEKGTNQMAPELRTHSNLELHEKTDIFDYRPSQKPDVILADVSFISLTKILYYAKSHLLNQDTELLVMLKPQFEARPEQLNSGVVKNNKIRRMLIQRFENWLKQNGYIIIKVRDNELKGKSGNQERFYYLKLAK